MTEDEMVGWHLNGHEFEQAPGDNEGQGSLACCSRWGCKESDRTEQPPPMWVITERDSINSGHQMAVNLQHFSLQI